jgi:hypothetical protein
VVDPIIGGIPSICCGMKSNNFHSPKSECMINKVSSGNISGKKKYRAGERRKKPGFCAV